MTVHDIEPSPISARNRLSWLLFAIASLYAGIFAYFLFATFVQAPIYDFLSWIAFYGDGPSDWLAYLWAPHNEHRITSDRLLVAMDVELFSGTELPFIVVRTSLLLTMLFSLIYCVCASDQSQRMKALLTCALVFLLLPAQLTVLCSMPLMGGFVYSSSLAIIALVLWQSPKGAMKAGALLVATIAPLGVAGGLFVWPVMAFSAWRSRVALVWLLISLLLGVAIWLVYLHGLPSQSNLSSLDARRLVASIDFILRFLGLPWSHAASLVWPGRAIGATVAGIGLYLVISDVITRDIKTSVERIGLAMIQFAFLIAAAAAVARWNVAADREMPIRYAMITAIAHAGILLASSSLLSRIYAGKHAATFQIAIVAIAGILLVQQVIVGRAASGEAALYASSWAQFSGGEWTPAMEHYVYPNRAEAEAMLQLLRRRHIYGQ